LFSIQKDKAFAKRATNIRAEYGLV